MFKRLRRALARIFVREERPARRARRPRRQEPDFAGYDPIDPGRAQPGADIVVTPSDDWLDSDDEWREVHPDLIHDVIAGMLIDMEAGDYL